LATFAGTSTSPSVLYQAQDQVAAGKLALSAQPSEGAALLLENSPASLRATKQLLNQHARAELDRQIEAAVRENAAVRTTADFREGVTSFLEKRKPVWTGK